MAVEIESAPARGYSREYYEARANSMLWAEIRQLLALAAVRPGDSVLELGCGGGQFLAACAERCPSLLIGTDLNRQALALSRRAAPVATLAMADAVRLPFEDEAFDVVVAQHLIEHFESADEVVLEWLRVLSPNGRLVVATPNARYPDTALFDDPTHHHIYTTESLPRLFERKGFNVERCYTLMPYLGNRRLTWALARHVAIRPLLAMRVLPYFRDHGLTLFLSARKGNAPESEEGRPA